MRISEDKMMRTAGGKKIHFF